MPFLWKKKKKKKKFKKLVCKIHNKGKRDINLVTKDKRRNQLAPERNYHTTKHFWDNSMAKERIKSRVKMNKPTLACQY